MTDTVETMDAGMTCFCDWCDSEISTDPIPEGGLIQHFTITPLDHRPDWGRSYVPNLDLDVCADCVEGFTQRKGIRRLADPMPLDPVWEAHQEVLRRMTQERRSA